MCIFVLCYRKNNGKVKRQSISEEAITVRWRNENSDSIESSTNRNVFFIYTHVYTYTHMLHLHTYMHMHARHTYRYAHRHTCIPTQACTQAHPLGSLSSAMR